MRPAKFILLCALSIFLFTNTVVRADWQTVSVSGVYNYDLSFRILELTNAERAKAGLAPLTYDFNLQYFAMQRAAEISYIYSHNHPDGSPTPYGENLDNSQNSAEMAINAWMNSETHRVNILYASYKTMAVGVFERNGRYYWVQEFTVRGNPGVDNGYRGRVGMTVNFSVESAVGQADILMNPGDRIKTVPIINGVEVDPTSVSWATSDASIAYIDSAGYVVAVNPGSCTISYHANEDDSGNSLTNTVLVRYAGTQSPTPASSIAAGPIPTVRVTTATTIPPTTTAPTTVATTTVPTTVASTVQTTVPTTTPTSNQTSGKTTETLAAGAAAVKPGSSGDQMRSMSVNEEGEKSPLLWIVIAVALSAGLIFFALRRRKASTEYTAQEPAYPFARTNPGYDADYGLGPESGDEFREPERLTGAESIQEAPSETGFMGSETARKPRRINPN